MSIPPGMNDMFLVRTTEKGHELHIYGTNCMKLE